MPDITITEEQYNQLYKVAPPTPRLPSAGDFPRRVTGHKGGFDRYGGTITPIYSDPREEANDAFARIKYQNTLQNQQDTGRRSDASAALAKREFDLKKTKAAQTAEVTSGTLNQQAYERGQRASKEEAFALEQQYKQDALVPKPNELQAIIRPMVEDKSPTSATLAYTGNPPDVPVPYVPWYKPWASPTAKMQPDPSISEAGVDFLKKFPGTSQQKWYETQILSNPELESFRKFLTKRLQGVPRDEIPSMMSSLTEEFYGGGGIVPPPGTAGAGTATVPPPQARTKPQMQGANAQGVQQIGPGRYQTPQGLIEVQPDGSSFLTRQ